jgi:TRAP-type transport system periplasmic protein
MMNFVGFFGERRMKSLLTRTAAAAALLTAALGAQAQTVLKVHHFLGPTSVQHTDMLQPWCDKVAKESANKLTCQIYPSMQLGGAPAQLFDQAKDGVADIVWTVAGYSANRFTKSQVFELPFMMTNADATSRAAWDYVQKHAQDEYKDVKLVAVHVHGPGVFFTTKKQVTKSEDLKGMKVRGPTATVTKMLASMGATPVGMPVPAVPESLSKGVIDGAVIPYEVAPGLKVHELTKFAAETPSNANALYTTFFVMAMNKAKYDALPADLKAVIDKNSGLETSAFLGRTQAGADEKGRKIFAATPGYTISTISAAELANWKTITDPIDDAWVQDIDKKGLNGKQMLQDARDLIKKYTK